MGFHHVPTPDHLAQMTPDAVFLWLTSEIYDARNTGDSDRINAILSCFAPDARRCLCTGAAAMRVMEGTADTEYRDALRSAMAKTLYCEMREEAQHEQ